ncbi:MAG: hypothetical protein OXU81_25140 [Gammaproteobacteria bacterium]|nr:hypothetical protein [Gammaproteobacteria bacterium]
MRFFNTEGPVVAERHYCIPSLERLDLAAVLDLIRQKRYFVIHAPRQTGTTCRSPYGGCDAGPDVSPSDDLGPPFDPPAIECTTSTGCTCRRDQALK